MTNTHDIQESPSVNDMPHRSPGWCFGPLKPFSGEEDAWWKLHEPTVDRWLAEMEAKNDPWWQSAEHAAYCLVSRDDDFSWKSFSVQEFLFRELWEGGTVSTFGSAEKFFDHLLEAVERFVADGVIPPSHGSRLLEEMREAQADFLRCYAGQTSEGTAIALARRRLSRPS